MKHTIFKIIIFFAVVTLLSTSCKKYEDFQVNPNQPSTATPALLLTNICISVFDYDPTGPAFASRQLTYYERGNSDVDYSWTSWDYGNYDILRQVTKMDELASEQSGQDNYHGLAKFFRAVLFNRLRDFAIVLQRRSGGVNYHMLIILRFLQALLENAFELCWFRNSFPSHPLAHLRDEILGRRHAYVG